MKTRIALLALLLAAMAACTSPTAPATERATPDITVEADELPGFGGGGMGSGH